MTEPTIDEQIEYAQEVTVDAMPGCSCRTCHYMPAIADSLKRLKAIDEGRGEWVDTSNWE